MKAKDYFVIGCKILGVYCVALSIPSFLAFIHSAIGSFSASVNFRNIFFSAAPFLANVALGVYLLAGGEAIYRLTYPEEEQILELSAERFSLCLKLLGLWMVANSLPAFFMTLLMMGVGVVVPAYFAEAYNVRYILTTILSQIWSLFFGIYLIKDGRYFIDMAYGSANSKQS